MGELSGKRITHDKRIAPELRILYRCPECMVGDTFDPYDGPPSCSGDPTHGNAHTKTFMQPLRIYKGD